MLGAPSFAVMQTLLIAAMGEPLTAQDVRLFTQLTGGTEGPAEAVDELWIIAVFFYKAHLSSAGLLFTSQAGNKINRWVGEHGMVMRYFSK